MLENSESILGPFKNHIFISAPRINAHVELFSLWCLGVHQGKVTKTRFSIAPDNGELNDWCACLHRAHIMPSIKAAASLPASTMDTANILWSLAAGISCTSKEPEHQNKIHPKQLDYIKEKDARKKNKANNKWHPTQLMPCAQRSVNEQRFPSRQNSPVLPPHRQQRYRRYG